MHSLTSFLQPRSLAEALSLLAEHGDRARPLAGGTALALAPNGPEILVDLQHIGLGYLERHSDELRLGAMATCRQIRQHLQDQPPSALYDAAGSIGSRILQNHVTVGGNCVMLYAWSDLPVALCCLQARFVLQGATRRELAADEFFAKHPTRQLLPGELLTEVIISQPMTSPGSAHVKFCRNETDQALASVSAYLQLENGRVSQARLVVGAVRGTPQLLSLSPASLIGQTLTAKRIEVAAGQAAQEAKVTEDYRSSAAYRQQLVRSLVQDALELALHRAGGAA
jgi:aerobic carbon-monoxide dehydrogenase medium subunit